MSIILPYYHIQVTYSCKNPVNQLYHFRKEGINSMGNFYGDDAILLYIENILLSQQFRELSFVIIPHYK